MTKQYKEGVVQMVVRCENVISLMKERKMTATELAKHYGCSQSAMSKSLFDRKNIKYEKAEKIAEILNCDISEIVEMRPRLDVGEKGQLMKLNIIDNALYLNKCKITGVSKVNIGKTTELPSNIVELTITLDVIMDEVVWGNK